MMMTEIFGLPDQRCRKRNNQTKFEIELITSLNYRRPSKLWLRDNRTAIVYETALGLSLGSAQIVERLCSQ